MAKKRLRNIYCRPECPVYRFAVVTSRGAVILTCGHCHRTQIIRRNVSRRKAAPIG